MAQITAGGKKRHMLTLTKSTVDEFQSLCQEYGFGPAAMSHLVDEYLRTMNKVIRDAIARGSFTMRDYMSMVGEQLDLIQQEENKDDQKRKAVKGRKKGAQSGA